MAAGLWWPCAQVDATAVWAIYADFTAGSAGKGAPPRPIDWRGSTGGWSSHARHDHGGARPALLGALATASRA